MSNFIGQSLGRYHILEQLGEGGMAVVYKAYDTHLECDVAIKIVRLDNLPRNAEERALKRFEREAKSVAKLDHPNIVKVTDYGEQDVSPYLVMPYLPGGTLKEFIKQRGQIPWQEAVQLLIPIAEALSYAHSQGMIHRDIKPSNILLTRSGQPMLTDFGVAKIIEDEATQDLTGTSATVGTPEYMAPEQITSKTVDARADLYSLGVVFYEMVTGRRPFVADTPLAVMVKHAHDPLPRPSLFANDLPENVERFLLKALAKSPTDRYQSAGEMKETIKNQLKVHTPDINTNHLPIILPDKPIRVTTAQKKVIWIIPIAIFGVIAVIIGLLQNKNGHSEPIYSPTILSNSSEEKREVPIPTYQFSTITPQPTSSIISGAFINYHEEFDTDFPRQWELNGPISNSDGEMSLKAGSGAYFGDVLTEGQTVLIKFKYLKDSQFSLIIHNEEDWDGSKFRRMGIYSPEKTGYPFFTAVTEGIDYQANDAWMTGQLIPEPDQWYLLMITIGGEADFQMRVWDLNDPLNFIELRRKMNNSWIHPRWHFRVFGDSGQVILEDFQVLRFIN